MTTAAAVAAMTTTTTTIYGFFQYYKCQIWTWLSCMCVNACVITTYPYLTHRALSLWENKPVNKKESGVDDLSTYLKNNLLKTVTQYAYGYVIIIMVGADDLVPIWRQVICNHNHDVRWSLHIRNATASWYVRSWLTDVNEPHTLTYAGLILCMRPANERRRYNETSSLIGWAHTKNDPCLWPNNAWSRKSIHNKTGKILIMTSHGHNDV